MRGSKNSVSFIAIVLIALPCVAVAVTPPPLVNFQGVLRDSSDNPLHGTTVDMVLKLYDTDGGFDCTSGTRLLTDSHLQSGTGGVAVTHGLFNVVLGGGVVTQGTKTSLPAVLRDHAEVYLQVHVDNGGGLEKLCPRTRMLSAPYALNADHLDGRDSGGFLDTSSTTQTKPGKLVLDAPSPQDYGVEAFGPTAGGYFEAASLLGRARVGDDSFGGTGVTGWGQEQGGYFLDLDLTSAAKIALDDWGIDAWGDAIGGAFRDDSSVASASTYAYLADRADGVGVKGYGTTGGSFQGTDVGGYFQGEGANAWIAHDHKGIEAYGNTYGGLFIQNAPGDGWGALAWNNRGLYAYGSTYGAYLDDSDSSSWVNVAYNSYKVYGSGTVNFVQNHPYEPDKVIVYTAPEGDEAATYTRGTSALVNGEARVRLGDTFKWVTNPDIGLTAYAVSREDCAGIYVASLTTEELVVRELGDGVSNAAFDYIVYGLRIGFEETSTVQEKPREAYIPSMEDHRALYERYPDLRKFNALERFQAMRSTAGKTDAADFTAATALRNAIEEYDPDVHSLTHEHPEVGTRTEESGSTLAGRPSPHGAGDSSNRPVETTGDPVVGASRPRTLLPVDEEGNVYAKSFRLSATDLASVVRVVGPVEAGDVLAIDAERPGLMKLARLAADTSVFGIVASQPGVVLGAERPGDAMELAGIDSGSIEAPSATEIAAWTEAPVTRVPVALSGVAQCKVDAGFGSIRPGDLLTSSPTPGHAMRTDDPRPGTILGKALEPLDTGTGAIEVLVMLR